MIRIIHICRVLLFNQYIFYLCTALEDYIFSEAFLGSALNMAKYSTC
jgi:hypothetical protein